MSIYLFIYDIFLVYAIYILGNKVLSDIHTHTHTHMLYIVTYFICLYCSGRMSRWVSSSQAMLFTLTCCLEVVFQEHYPVNCVKDQNLIYNGVSKPSRLLMCLAFE